MRGFYRNTDDTWLAGVCGGLAKYFDIDPSIIRVLMALFCFAGWGIILYVVLWIILPAKPLGQYTGKRFYRDMDNKAIGGVASGIADYFAWDIRIVRLVFVAPLILSIFFSAFSWPFFFNGLWFWNVFFHGSVTGTVVFGYFLLWIVLPPSHRDSPRKPQSREPSQPSVHASSAGDSNTPSGESRTVSESIGQPIGVLLRILFFFVAGILIFALLVALMAILFAGAFLWPLGGYFWSSSWQQYYALGSLILFLGLPILGLIIWLMRRAMGAKRGSFALRLTFGTLWIVGLVSLLCLVVSLGNDFRYYENGMVITLPMNSPPKDGRLNVVVSEPALSPNHGWWVENETLNWDFSDDVLKLPFVRIRPLKSPDKSFHVSMLKFSAGKNPEEAKQRAEEVQYTATYKDGTLDLGNGISVLQASKYRLQNVVIQIFIPVGKRISFDSSVKEKLNGIDVYVVNGERWSRRDMRISSRAFRWKTNTDYVMGENGELAQVP